MRQAAFLDRDGVINRARLIGGRSYPPPTLAAFEILPGVADTIRDFRRAGLLNIVVTNQPDIAKGTQDRQTVDAMHDVLMSTLDIDEIKVCYCIEGPGCDCYKPKPGMLLEAAKDWEIDLARSFLVGDRWRDIGAGNAVGCETFFIDYGYEERQPDRPDYVVSSLADAGKIILKKVRPS